MTPRFVRFTVAGCSDRPVVINVAQIQAYGPFQGKTFIQVGGEEYHVSEEFEVVDALVSGGAA